MSVIIEDPDGNIKILCKGADSIILKRMNHTKYSAFYYPNSY